MCGWSCDERFSPHLNGVHLKGMCYALSMVIFLEETLTISVTVLVKKDLQKTVHPLLHGSLKGFSTEFDDDDPATLSPSVWTLKNDYRSSNCSTIYAARCA